MADAVLGHLRDDLGRDLAIGDLVAIVAADLVGEALHRRRLALDQAVDVPEHVPEPRAQHLHHGVVADRLVREDAARLLGVPDLVADQVDGVGADVEEAIDAAGAGRAREVILRHLGQVGSRLEDLNLGRALVLPGVDDGRDRGLNAGLSDRLPRGVLGFALAEVELLYVAGLSRRASASVALCPAFLLLFQSRPRLVLRLCAQRFRQGGERP